MHSLHLLCIWIGILVSTIAVSPLVIEAVDTGCTRGLQSDMLRAKVSGWGDIALNKASKSSYPEVSFGLRSGICEARRAKTLKQQFQLVHLYPFQRTITLGGHPTVQNLLWNNTDEHNQCDLKSLPHCQAENHTGLDDGTHECLLNEQEIDNYTQNQLKNEVFTKAVPFTSENVDLLPFPDAFKVTVLDVKPSRVCGSSESVISCHLAIDNDCSYYMCHKINLTQLIEVEFQYHPQKEEEDSTNLNVTMTMMCHYRSIESIHADDFLFNLLKENGGNGTVCHIVSKQTSFFMC